MRKYLVSALSCFIATSAFAGTSGNVHLSVKIYKGDEIISSAERHAIPGKTITLENSEAISFVNSATKELDKIILTPGLIRSGVAVEITPEEIANDKLSLTINCELNDVSGTERFTEKTTGLSIESPIQHYTMFKAVNTIEKDTPYVHQFGVCPTEGDERKCSHKLIIEMI